MGGFNGTYCITTGKLSIRRADVKGNRMAWYELDSNGSGWIPVNEVVNTPIPKIKSEKLPISWAKITFYRRDLGQKK